MSFSRRVAGTAECARAALFRQRFLDQLFTRQLGTSPSWCAAAQGQRWPTTDSANGLTVATYCALNAPWRDGTTHLCFEPIELMERLAAQIPKPRINLVLYAGVLDPNAKLRKRVVGYARPRPLPEQQPATETQTRAEKESWSELMRLTFGLDVLASLRCGGRMGTSRRFWMAEWRAVS